MAKLSGALFALALTSTVALADDVVVMHDGTVLRGTIVETVPGEYVVIAQPTGNQRIAGADVQYAGPEENAPQLPSAEGEGLAPGAAVRVRFESPQERVAFHRILGASTATAWSHGSTDLELICHADCDLTIAAGSYHLALTHGEGNAVDGGIVDIMESGTARGDYVDRSGIRVAGWITMGVGLAAAIAMMIVPMAVSPDIDNDETWIHWFMAGSGVLAVTEIIGIILALQPDAAVIRFD